MPKLTLDGGSAFAELLTIVIGVLMALRDVAWRALSVDCAGLQVLGIHRGANVPADGAEDFARAVLEASWLPPAAMAADT